MKLRGIDVTCPACGSKPGVGCNDGRWTRNHTERTAAARAVERSELPQEETTILVGDKRRPVAGHANYTAGANVPDPWSPLGPNTLGERVWPCTVQLRDDGRVRIGFSYTTPWVGDRVDPSEQEKLALLQPMLRELRRELMKGEVQ